MTNKTLIYVRKHFYRYCLQCFSNSKILKNYIKICRAINHIKTVTLNEENTYFKFKKFKRLLKALFIIYADFESLLKPAADDKKDVPNTK